MTVKMIVDLANSQWDEQAPSLDWVSSSFYKSMARVAHIHYKQCLQFHQAQCGWIQCPRSGSPLGSTVKPSQSSTQNRLSQKGSGGQTQGQH